MAITRQCSRQTCQREAIFTLTYAYAQSTAVIGPLSVHREPHAYDLCEFHADRLTAPQGWDVVRLDAPTTSPAAEEQADASYPPLRSV
ncbi:DUF3499 domain-containing protein [Rothia sp. SD9660Na]|uniref:DUF3499 domain-containing protein n=1 Tax=Rothia sp. SD9660Na TaxID=3047030 RepID=UPI0024BA9A7A|nr:DUF3499 domain-containing protein [Rothia sp. SD9660Na]WHS50040.1 DUF3499 domain-containing protein [Rothia sp. SD9660Na]